MTSNTTAVCLVRFIDRIPHAIVWHQHAGPCKPQPRGGFLNECHPIRVYASAAETDPRFTDFSAVPVETARRLPGFEFAVFAGESD